MVSIAVKRCVHRIAIDADKLYAKKCSLRDFLDTLLKRASSHLGHHHNKFLIGKKISNEGMTERDVLSENNLKSPDGVTCFKLATCALLGIGTEQDDLKAFEYYRLAADQGHASAQARLAWMYLKGRAEPARSQAERDVIVCHYFKLAVDQGNAIAQHGLALMYQEGRAELGLSQTERDVIACHHFKLAAEQGNAYAQGKLAYMYREGRAEVERSQAERDVIACQYYKLAADQGDACTQANLACMYEDGRAEPLLSQAERDVIACQYYQLAAAGLSQVYVMP